MNKRLLLFAWMLGICSAANAELRIVHGKNSAPQVTKEHSVESARPWQGKIVSTQSVADKLQDSMKPWQGKVVSAQSVTNEQQTPISQPWQGKIVREATETASTKRYVIESGARLDETLGKWAEEEGYTLIWHPDVSWRTKTRRVLFAENALDAIEKVTSSLSQLGKTLRIVREGSTITIDYDWTKR